jgi:dipeptidase E
MKFYLSSYKLGDRTAELKDMIVDLNKKTAYISNALDFSSDLERREKSEAADIADLKSVGMEIEKVDLRDYFGKQAKLEEKLNEYNIIWVRGGNVFVLRQAMKLSGFDEIMIKLLKKDDVVYGGYSAGVCVLAPTLKGIDLVDDPNVRPYPEQTKTIWEGLSILDYAVVPHYSSDHTESDAVNNVIKYMIDNKILFKAIRDGEVIIF